MFHNAGEAVWVPAGTASVLFRGVLLGLGAAAPLGPVNVEIARRTLRTGRLAGFALGCGAVSVDMFYALLSSLSLAHLLNRPWVTTALTAAGIALLTYLGVHCFRAAAKDFRHDPLVGESAMLAARRVGLVPTYLTGVLMTLFNPMTLAFWFTVVPSQANRGPAGAGGNTGLSSLLWLGAGVFVGTLSWVVAFVNLLGWVGRFRRNWWLAGADLLGGLILVAFAALGFLRLLRAFL